MKKLLIILCLVFFAGCANENFPLRSQVRTGMTITQIWELYGFNSSDPNTHKNKVYYEDISEQVAGECTLKTYRFWFKNTRKNTLGIPALTAKPIPSLLIFQSCRLPNYDAVQKEKGKMIHAFKEVLKNNPELREEIDIFCEENQLDSENRNLLIELLALDFYKAPQFPQCVTEQTLIKITLDQATIRHRQNLRAISGIQNQLRANQEHLQQIQRQQNWMQMQQFQQRMR